MLPPEESSGYTAAFAHLLPVRSRQRRDLIGFAFTSKVCCSVAEISPGELSEQSGQERGAEESEEHL